MKIIVLGGGVIGVTSAYYLARAGAEVTLVDRMMRVAEYSRDCLRELRAKAGLQYEQRSGGTLQVFRSQAQLDAA
jgi:2-polyprenyl-6-methoxyphenol hydroxylase-like FAD-dependent oxidoreductase